MTSANGSSTLKSMRNASFRLAAWPTAQQLSTPYSHWSPSWCPLFPPHATYSAYSTYTPRQARHDLRLDCTYTATSSVFKLFRLLLVWQWSPQKRSYHCIVAVRADHMSQWQRHARCNSMHPEPRPRHLILFPTTSEKFFNGGGVSSERLSYQILPCGPSRSKCPRRPGRLG